nr:J domain-containing protein [Stutzerimonas stutzeri]
MTIVDAIPDSAIDWIPEWLQIILGIGIFIGTLAFAPLIYSKTVLPWWSSSWLYVRLNLGVSIDPAEAEKISFLFDGSMPGGKWYPLHGFREIEGEFRREALFVFANRVSRENGWKIPFPEYEPAQENRTKEENVRDSGAAQRARIEQIIMESHRVLGITELPTSFDAVKMAYRRKIAQYHPDKFAGEQAEVIRYAEETAKKLNGAYSILEKYYQTVS